MSDAVSGEYVGMIDVADLLKGLIKGERVEMLGAEQEGQCCGPVRWLYTYMVP